MMDILLDRVMYDLVKFTCLLAVCRLGSSGLKHGEVLTNRLSLFGISIISLISALPLCIRQTVCLLGDPVNLFHKISKDPGRFYINLANRPLTN